MGFSTKSEVTTEEFVARIDYWLLTIVDFWFDDDARTAFAFYFLQKYSA